MTNYASSTVNAVVAFTTFNPGFEFLDYLHVAASECPNVIVVDDGSRLGLERVRQVEATTAGISVLSKIENCGIADSVNRALDYAIGVNASYLLFFDQDTVVLPGIISSILDSAIRYEAASERNMFGCLGAGVIHGRPVSAGTRSGLLVVPEVIQSGTVFSVPALNSIGGANSALFIDAVDTDICLRLRERGYQILVDASIYISHPVGSGEAFEIFGRSVMRTHHSPLRRYYMTRNRIFLLTQRRWWRQDVRWCLTYLRRFVVSCFIAIAFEHDRRAKCRAIIEGVTDGCRGRLGKRRYL